MGARGPAQRDECVNKHDLTDESNVKIVRRGAYTERQCKECQRERARRWWNENRGKKATDAST